jgi:hypothetical protein
MIMGKNAILFRGEQIVARDHTMLARLLRDVVLASPTQSRLLD